MGEETRRVKQHFVSGCCDGEKCRICRKPAAHKVEEVIFTDDPGARVMEEDLFTGDPQPIRHPLAAYLCCGCFTKVVGSFSPCQKVDAAWECIDCQTVNPQGALYCKKCMPVESETSARETLQDLLSLVLPRTPTSAVIATWTPEQRTAAADWAAASYAFASDHDDVTVPAIPEFLQQYVGSSTRVGGSSTPL